MITSKEIKAERRKIQRQELKQIESYLHPCPVLNNTEILHEHKGQRIIFTAWVKDNPINNKILNYHRADILANKHFYNTESLEFRWLATDNCGKEV